MTDPGLTVSGGAGIGTQGPSGSQGLSCCFWSTGRGLGEAARWGTVGLPGGCRRDCGSGIERQGDRLYLFPDFNQSSSSSQSDS